MVARPAVEPQGPLPARLAPHPEARACRVRLPGRRVKVLLGSSGRAGDPERSSEAAREAPGVRRERGSLNRHERRPDAALGGWEARRYRATASPGRIELRRPTTCWTPAARTPPGRPTLPATPARVVPLWGADAGSPPRAITSELAVAKESNQRQRAAQVVPQSCRRWLRQAGWIADREARDRFPVERS